MNRFYGESGHFPSGGSAQSGLQAIQAAVLRHSLRESEPLSRGIRALSPLAGPRSRDYRLSRRLSSGIPSGKVNCFHGESGHFPSGGSAQSGLQAIQAAVLRHSLRESEPLSRGIWALSPWRVCAAGPRVLQAAVLWHSYRGSEPLPRGIWALSPWRVRVIRAIGATGYPGGCPLAFLPGK